ncbi:MAG: hypothetical protein ACLSVX_01230 [Massilimicrobiota timonensis]
MYTLNEFVEKLGYAVLIIILLVFFALLTGIPVYFLWNWLMPEIFGLTEITLLQAIGLSLLCSLLFKPNINSD